jgi:hypothetical protein
VDVVGGGFPGGGVVIAVPEDHAQCEERRGGGSRITGDVTREFACGGSAASWRLRWWAACSRVALAPGVAIRGVRETLVREQRVDTNGLIRVHEHRTAEVHVTNDVRPVAGTMSGASRRQDGTRSTAPCGRRGHVWPPRSSAERPIAPRGRAADRCSWYASGNVQPPDSQPSSFKHVEDQVQGLVISVGATKRRLIDEFRHMEFLVRGRVG